MKHLALIAALLVPAAHPALAETLPALFDVTGVAPGDVLNIRAEPSASAALRGSLAPDAKGIEGITRRGGWMQVNAGEAAGWVSARFLARGAAVWGSGLPPTLHCSGTEPFWSLKQAQGGLVLSTPDAADRHFALRQVLDGGLPQGAQRSVLADGLTAVIAPAACSDGMSDRAYGLTATVILGEAPEAQQLSGCCSVAR